MGALRVGIVGAGGNGTSFVRIYGEDRNCQVAAVCDLSEERLDDIRERFRVPMTTTDYREVTRSEDVDAVSVHTSDAFHAPVALDALGQGKHVFVEKPMATTIDDCQRMVRAARHSNVVLAVGMVLRTNPNFRRLRRMVEEGFFGDIFCVEGTYNTSHLRSPGAQEAIPRKWSRAFACSATHTLDLMRWYAGEVVEATAYANEDRALPGSGGYDEFIGALYRFESGAVGMLSATWADNYDCYPDYDIGIHGSRATLKNGRLYLSSAPGVQEDAGWEEVAGHPYDPEAHAFVDAVVSGGRPVVDGEEGARTTVAVICGVQAAQQGRPVRVPQI